MNRAARDWRLGLVAMVTLAAVILTTLLDPIPQDQAYHRFAADDAVRGIPGFWNVVSNLAFLLAGLHGIWRRPPSLPPWLRASYLLLAIGVILVGLGSAYYHLTPADATLAWDRAAMAWTFTAFSYALLIDRSGLRPPAWLLPLLIALGMATVWYWLWSETGGRGDLRWYALLQFGPLLLAPLLLLLYPHGVLRVAPLVASLGCYALAKASELLDGRLWELTGLLAGHPLKHLFAAAGAWLALRAFHPGRRSELA